MREKHSMASGFLLTRAYKSPSILSAVKSSGSAVTILRYSMIAGNILPCVKNFSAARTTFALSKLIGSSLRLGMNLRGAGLYRNGKRQNRLAQNKLRGLAPQQLVFVR